MRPIRYGEAIATLVELAHRAANEEEDDFYKLFVLVETLERLLIYKRSVPRCDEDEQEIDLAEMLCATSRNMVQGCWSVLERRGDEAVARANRSIERTLQLVWPAGEHAS